MVTNEPQLYMTQLTNTIDDYQWQQMVPAEEAPIDAK
jgi:hypothetical protein